MKIRKLKYKSLKGKLKFILLNFCYVIDFIILVVSLGNYTIDLAETLLFDCNWIDD
jgi:hypothetical protein